MHFPVSIRDSEELATVSFRMHERLDAALALAPSLGPYAARLRSTYDALPALADVPIQRVHGDLHLGQTLRTVRGWKIVDFEGEPARALSERRQLDSPWRDIAGMLRSFDYVPRAVERSVGEGDPDGAEFRASRAREWAVRNQEAFLSAYAGRELTETETILLAAYSADKAVYETVYETRNRPTWVSIPLEALATIGAA